MADLDALKLLVDQQRRDAIAAREEAKLECDEANRRHAENQRMIEELEDLLVVLRAGVAQPAVDLVGNESTTGVGSTPDSHGSVTVMGEDQQCQQHQDMTSEKKPTVGAAASSAATSFPGVESLEVSSIVSSLGEHVTSQDTATVATTVSGGS